MTDDDNADIIETTGVQEYNYNKTKDGSVSDNVHDKPLGTIKSK